MNFTYYPFKPFNIKENSLNVIDINNVKLYTQIINNLMEYSEKVIFSDDNFRKIRNNKAYQWLGDPLLNLDLDQLFIGQIERKLENSLLDDQKSDLVMEQQKVSSKVLDKSDLMDLPITVNTIPKIHKMFKDARFSFIKDAIDTPYDKINVLVKTLNELNNHQLIVLTNISHYLDKNDIKQLNDLSSDYDATILDIEKTNQNRNLNFNDSYVYIDNDFCLWD